MRHKISTTIKLVHYSFLVELIIQSFPTEVRWDHDQIKFFFSSFRSLRVGLELYQNKTLPRAKPSIRAVFSCYQRDVGALRLAGLSACILEREIFLNSFSSTFSGDYPQLLRARGGVIY